MAMPSVFVSQDDDIVKSNLFDGGDEVNDLNILRLMAKRSYIISCYEVAVESINLSNAETLKDPSSPEPFLGHLGKIKCIHIISRAAVRTKN